MDLEVLPQILLEWQRTLKLLDWDISAFIAPSEEMDSSEGLVYWDLNKKIAEIKIVSREDYPSDAMCPYCIEKILVHELLHLHFAPFDAKTGTLRGTAQEQAINAIAHALVKLKYANLSPQGATANSSPTA